MFGMSGRSLAHAAAQNNAEWCHAFCRTHGVVGRFDAALWSSPVRPPPFYPDAVALLPELRVEQVLARIDGGEGCGVKDSFASLDLGAAGFQPLFHAEWLVRTPAEDRQAFPRHWSAIGSEAELRDWEDSWGEVPGGSSFFRSGPSRRLGESRCLPARSGDRVAAGAIANRSATVVGLSNVFDVDGDLESAWKAGAATAAALWGDMPIVGYDSGDSLDAAHVAGFESVGELVVSVNAPTPPPMSLGPDHGLSERSRGQSVDHASTVVAQVQIGAPCSSLSRSTPLSIRAESTQPLKSPRSASGWW